MSLAPSLRHCCGFWLGFADVQVDDRHRLWRGQGQGFIAQVDRLQARAPRHGGRVEVGPRLVVLGWRREVDHWSVLGLATGMTRPQPHPQQDDSRHRAKGKEAADGGHHHDAGHHQSDHHPEPGPVPGAGHLLVDQRFAGSLLHHPHGAEGVQDDADAQRQAEQDEGDSHQQGVDVVANRETRADASDQTVLATYRGEHTIGNIAGPRLMDRSRQSGLGHASIIAVGRLIRHRDPP